MFINDRQRCKLLRFKSSLVLKYGTHIRFVGIVVHAVQMLLVSVPQLPVGYSGVQNLVPPLHKMLLLKV